MVCLRIYLQTVHPLFSSGGLVHPSLFLALSQFSSHLPQNTILQSALVTYLFTYFPPTSRPNNNTPCLSRRLTDCSANPSPSFVRRLRLLFSPRSLRLLYLTRDRLPRLLWPDTDSTRRQKRCRSIHPRPSSAVAITSHVVDEWPSWCTV